MKKNISAGHPSQRAFCHRLNSDNFSNTSQDQDWAEPLIGGSSLAILLP